MRQLNEMVQNQRVIDRSETLANSGTQALAAGQNDSESLAAVAHDARNMVAALGLYCDLLEEPGVLTVPYSHYAKELRLLAGASRRLVEKLVAFDCRATFGRASGTSAPIAPPRRAEEDEMPWLKRELLYESGTQHESAAKVPGQVYNPEVLLALPIENLAAELLANRNVLAALAGPATVLTVETTGGANSVRLTGEDLTRVLVNLVKNASEAMPAGGRIRIGLSEWPAAGEAAACTLLTVEDNGPGVPRDALETIFTAGFTTRGQALGKEDWPMSHRGLGLAISRSIVEAAGGRMWAANRGPEGACFSIELPVRQGHAAAGASGDICSEAISAGMFGSVIPEGKKSGPHQL